MEKGLLYIQSLLKDKDAGLLEHEIICAIASAVLNEEVGYSENRRYTVYNNEYKEYELSHRIYPSMQALIDRTNNLSWTIKHGKNDAASIKSLLAHFTMDFMSIHPFKDGNGRTLRLILLYLINSFNGCGVTKQGLIINSFYFKINYSKWCNSCNSHHRICRTFNKVS